MRYRRVIFVTIVFLLMLIQWTGMSEARSKKATYVWKMATHAPEVIGFAIYLRDTFTPALEKVTNKEVTIDWYWGGIMGDDEDWVAKIRIDQLQGAGFDGHGIVMACPDLAMFQLPFLFKSFDEVAFIREKLRQRLLRSFEKNGYKLLLLIDQDFDQVYSLKREIRSPEDFARTTFVTYSGKVENEMLRTLGTSPIPINVPEIPSSLRAGICDALIAPAIWYVGAQLYTITKAVTPSTMRYAPGGIVISTKAWNGIPEEYRKTIDGILLEHEHGFNEYGHDGNARCLRAMIKYGVKEVRLNQVEIDLLKQRTRPLWDKLAGKEYPRDLLDEVLCSLDEYRSREASIFIAP
jgi:TRAP-type C4-dicarboxylate transport system substrate-binding protein